MTFDAIEFLIGLTNEEASRAGETDGPELRATLSVAALPTMDRFDGRDAEEGQEGSLVRIGVRDKDFGLEQGGGVGIGHDKGLAPGCEDSEGLKRVAVQQFADRVGGAHANSVALPRTGPQGNDWTRQEATRYRPPEEWDDSDRAAVEWLLGLRESFSARPAAADRPSGVPEGWTRETWRGRLEQLAVASETVNPGRARELRAEAEKLAPGGSKDGSGL